MVSENDVNVSRIGSKKGLPRCNGDNQTRSEERTDKQLRVRLLARFACLKLAKLLRPIKYGYSLYTMDNGWHSLYLYDSTDGGVIVVRDFSTVPSMKTLIADVQRVHGPVDDECAY